jgi:anthraniloyl-CoA monooxygenase
MKIACVGAGPAGLYLAILMKKQDPANEITVYERNPPEVTYGWGVVFWGDLVEDLEEGDPETASEIVAQSFAWTGTVLDVKGNARIHADGTGFSIRRQRLLEA